MTNQTKQEYLSVLRSRYQSSSLRRKKSSILDELVGNLQVTRKHAIKLLNRQVLVQA